LKTHRACRARRCALGPRAIKSIARGPDTKLLLQREDPTPIARVPDAAARELVDTRVRQANAVDAHVGHGGTIFEFEEVSVALTTQSALVVAAEHRDLAPSPKHPGFTFAPEELGEIPVDRLFVDDDGGGLRPVSARGKPGHRLGAIRGTDSDRLRLVQTAEVNRCRVVNDLEGVCDLLGIANSIQNHFADHDVQFPQTFVHVGVVTHTLNYKTPQSHFSTSTPNNLKFS